MDLECSAVITKIAIKAKEDDGIVSRIVRMTLAREFDFMIAAAIGGDASALLDSLKSHGANKVEMPIDGITGECRLEGEQGDEVTIKLVAGIKAVGKAPKAEDEHPFIELVFDFPFHTKAWEFFGRNVGARAAISFRKSQLDLPGTAKPDKDAAAKGGKKPNPMIAAAAAQAMGTLTQQHVDDVRDYVESRRQSPARTDETTDEQLADSPEEAEARREERLETERGAAELTAHQRAEIDAIVEVRSKDITVEPAGQDADWDAEYTAKVRHRSIDFRFHGATREEARARCIEAIRTFETEQAVAYPSGAPGAEATAAALAGSDQVDDEADEVPADVTKKHGLKVPTRGPRPTSHKTFGGKEAHARKPGGGKPKAKTARGAKGKGKPGPGR